MLGIREAWLNAHKDESITMKPGTMKIFFGK